MKKVFPIVVIVLLIVLGAWIGESRPWIKAVEERSGFDLIDKKQKELVAMGSKVKTLQIIGDAADFSSRTDDPRIPSTVPDEFVYPGATVQVVQQLGGRGMIAVLATSEPKAKVADFLLKALVEADWKQTSGSLWETADFEKSNQKAQVGVATEGQITIISLGLTFSD